MLDALDWLVQIHPAMPQRRGNRRRRRRRVSNDVGHVGPFTEAASVLKSEAYQFHP